MVTLYYIGLDVHKKWIEFCVKLADGDIVLRGKVRATRQDLEEWARSLPGPWIGAMEATMFSGWIYDVLRPFAQDLKVAHPQMLKAIVASKKKNDKVDAEKLADAVRCNLLPEAYMAPSYIRELRRILRYRNLLVRESTRFRNRARGMLLECGAQFDSKRLHGKRYFRELLGQLTEVPQTVLEMLQANRVMLDLFQDWQRRLLRGLETHLALDERVARLRTIPGVGLILALTWALEIGERDRFTSVRRAISYCGLCSAQDQSANHCRRGPLSKQRNANLQWVLIEAAKMGVQYNPQLRAVYERERTRGSRNRATLAVARKLVAYLLAVDRSGKPFELRDEKEEEKQMQPVGKK